MPHGLKKILYRLPLTVKFFLLSLLAGMIIAGITMGYAESAIQSVVMVSLNRQLDQQSMEDRLRFDHQIKKFNQVVRLTVTHQPFLDYLDGEDWFGTPRLDTPVSFHGLPAWLLQRSSLRVLAVPRHVVLLDADGITRQVFCRYPGEDVPDDVLQPSWLLLTKSHGQAYLRNINGLPYVLSAETIENRQGRKITLLLTSPIDDEFLLSSQRELPKRLVGLVNPYDNTLLVSNAPELLPPGSNLDVLQDDFVISGREYHDYGSAEMVIRLSSFVPTAEIEAMKALFLNNVRTVSAISAGIFISVFTAIMLWITSRIRTLSQKVELFAQGTLNGQYRDLPRGDSLHALSERFELLTKEVRISHQRVKQETEEKLSLRLEEESNRRQIKLLESVTDAMNVGVMIRGKSSYLPSNNRMHYYQELCGDIACFAGTECSEEEKTITTLDGDSRSFMVSNSCLCAGKEVILVNDITEQKRAEEEKQRLQTDLFQAQKMDSIGRLAGGIAHDFNNILTAINGYAQLSLMKLKKDDPLRQNLLVIAESGDMAADLTRQLLTFSRRQAITPTPLDLNDLVAGMQKMLPRLIGADIEVKHILAEKLWTVMTDKTQIEQILINLAVNGRDAMPRGGKLIIETENIIVDDTNLASYQDITPGEHVRLSITDTGTGIRNDDLEHIFEPFYTTKELGKGTGMGLATVYGIVKQNNGSIYVHSEEGIGTTFKIYLPAVLDEVDQHGRQVTDETLPEGTETVLVVEDSQRVRRFIITVLASLGYKIIEASNSQKAMALFEKFPDKIDLLLADILLPGMRGSEMAKKMIAERPNLRLLFMTGYTDNSLLHMDFHEKDVRLLQKPLSPMTLAMAVREALDGTNDSPS